MAVEHHPVYAVGGDDGQGRVDVGEIFAEVACLEPPLALHERAAVLAQVHGVERIAVVGKLTGHVGLEEVVVEAVDVQRGHAAGSVGAHTHHGTAHRAGVVVGVGDVGVFKLGAQDVGGPARRGARHRGQHEDEQ